ncbi:MAG TPA: NAD(+) diphosphatase [Arthrobacter sp.]|nr:NAD(+) diphosphatase [Arthrobacter sp.]
MSNTVPEAGLSPEETHPPLGSLALARIGVDRGCDRRLADGMMDKIWSEPSTKVMLIHRGKTLVRDFSLALVETAQTEQTQWAENLIYLGRTTVAADEPAGTDVVLMILKDEPAGWDDGAEWLGLREVATELSPRDAALFVEAAAVSNWHATHTHCPRCGSPTEVEAGGWVRRCPLDNSEHYPRTDPAIIVTVVDDQDRLLLGNSAQWSGNRFSTLAGFVEPGESLEAAVVREIAEESGVVVHSPKYMGSQPWPFPCSLMLGFTAQAEGTETMPDGVEITAVRWFTREELAEAVSSGEIQIASGASIARSLIEHWYGGPIVEPAETPE